MVEAGLRSQSNRSQKSRRLRTEYGTINSSLFSSRSGGIEGRPPTLYIAAKVGDRSRNT
ncbi:MAG: hypothetical protein OJF52_002141 [Nitrospira sp.]|nr:MAG: hypothetical protein OJF52_002141 [Nitrospira sp.]